MSETTQETLSVDQRMALIIKQLAEQKKQVVLWAGDTEVGPAEIEQISDDGAFVSVSDGRNVFWVKTRDVTMVVAQA